MINRILSEIYKKNFINMYGGGINNFSHTIPILNNNNSNIYTDNDKYKLVLKHASYYKGKKFVNDNHIDDVKFTKDSLKDEIDNLEKFNVRVYYGNNAVVITYEK